MLKSERREQDLRHNIVLGALDYSLRRFGVVTAVEPTSYFYDDGTAKRPDITCLGSPPIATDLVISVDVPTALAGKMTKHRCAVERLGHEFVPIGISIFGELADFDKFLLKAFASLDKSTRRLAILQTKRAVSEAWMMGTVAMIQAVAQDSSQFTQTSVQPCLRMMGVVGMSAALPTVTGTVTVTAVTVTVTVTVTSPAHSRLPSR